MADNGRAEHHVCEEMTAEKLAELVQAGKVEKSRVVMAVVADGPAPTGQLVRARLQRQEIRDGKPVWVPAR